MFRCVSAAEAGGRVFGSMGGGGLDSDEVSKKEFGALVFQPIGYNPNLFIEWFQLSVVCFGFVSQCFVNS